MQSYAFMEKENRPKGHHQARSDPFTEPLLDSESSAAMLTEIMPSGLIMPALVKRTERQLLNTYLRQKKC